MDITVFLAQVFGVSFVVYGASMLVRQKDLKHILDGFMDNEALRYFAGMCLMLVGLLAVLKHNIWGGSKLETIISVLSWAVLLKGVVYVLAPRATFKHFEKLASNKSLYPVAGIVVILVGLYLVKMGF